jgi:hypothetical protein
MSQLLAIKKHSSALKRLAAFQPLALPRADERAYYLTDVSTVALPTYLASGTACQKAAVSCTKAHE